MAAQPKEPEEKEIGFKRIELYKDQVFGIGAFGAVCNAQCDDLPCAAKILHPTMFAMAGQYQVAQRFEQECKLICTVKHPNIVQYFGVHHDSLTGQPTLLMELMDENLTHLLESSPNAIPFHIQVNVCRDIALALSFLHSNDIIHRNLSSNNVLLISNVRAKVSDFGMARLSSLVPQGSYLTYNMSPVTRAYMPPEVLKNNLNCDEKIDCFSFGVIAVQVMTQKFPSPTDLYKPMETVNVSSTMSYVIIPEIDRRENHISLIDPDHPLLPIACLCLNDDSAERPSAQILYEKVKNLQENGEYRVSVSETFKRNNVPIKDVNFEKNGYQVNQPYPVVDACTNTPNLECTCWKLDSLQTIVERNTEEQRLLDKEQYITVEQPKSQEVIIVAAEVYPTENESSSEQTGTSKKRIASDQDNYECDNYVQDHKKTLLEVVSFDHNKEKLNIQDVRNRVQHDNTETVQEKSLTKSQESSNTNDGDKKYMQDDVDASIPLPNDEVEGDKSKHDDRMTTEQPNQESEYDDASATEQLKQESECDDSIAMETPKQESECDDGIAPKQESKFDNASAAEQTKQESKQDDANTIEQSESKHDDGSTIHVEQPKQTSMDDDTSTMEQPKQQRKHDDYGNATEEPKKESKCDDASDMVGEERASLQDNAATKKCETFVNGKEKKSNSLKKATMVHDAGLMDDITILSSEMQDCPVADSDNSAVKPDSFERKKGNRM